jgi:Holliday junction DNA helicase RuvA
MIGKLKGLIDGFGDDYVHLDVNGVVYEAFCSAKTLATLPKVGEAAVVQVMTVQGVGAKVALSILSTLAPGELSSAIALQDKAMVGRASGVGPKLAVRLVTELKGKVPVLGGIEAGLIGLQAALGEGRAGGNVTDAVSALSNLGYSGAQASAALARVVAREGDGLATEKLIRLGLRELSS